MSDQTKPVPGWYGDPYDGSQLRWWDGTTWTSNTRERPVVAPVAPVPPAGPEAVSESAPIASDEPAAPEPAGAEASASAPTEDVSPQLPASTEAVGDTDGYPEIGPYVPPAIAAEADMVPAAVAPTPSDDIEALAAAPNSRRGLKITLIVILVVVVIAIAGAAAWFLLKPKATSAPATAPTTAASSSIAPSCQKTVEALTANGTTSNVVGRLTSTAAGIDLPGAVQYFSAVTALSSPVLATSGTECLGAVGTQQAPATYATFISSFAKAVKDGVAISSANVATGKVPADQSATLTTDASQLTAASTAVGSAPTPPATPAPPPGPPTG